MRVSLSGALIGLALLAIPVANAVPITGFEEYADGATVMFHNPGFSGSTSGSMATTPNTAVVTSAKAFSGDKSLKVDWAWKDDNPAKWLRLTTANAPLLLNPTIDLSQALSMKIFIEGPAALGFAATVRETGTNAAIGANGGVTGGIEFVGSTTGGSPTPLASNVFAPGAWHTLIFDFQADPIKAFAGTTADGVLSSPNMMGVLDGLAIRSPGFAGPWTLYIDDIQVVASPSAIPEPGSMALLATGLVPLVALRRRAR